MPAPVPPPGQELTPVVAPVPPVAESSVFPQPEAAEVSSDFGLLFCCAFQTNESFQFIFISEYWYRLDSVTETFCHEETTRKSKRRWSARSHVQSSDWGTNTKRFFLKLKKRWLFFCYAEDVKMQISEKLHKIKFFFFLLACSATDHS